MRYLLLVMLVLLTASMGCSTTKGIKMSKQDGLEAPDKLWGEQSAVLYNEKVTTDSHERTIMAYGLTKDSITALGLGLGGAAMGGATAGAAGAAAGGLGGALIGAWSDSKTSATPNVAAQALTQIGRMPELPQR